MSWIRVTSVDSIPVREGRAIQLGGREIAIFNLADRFVAIDNECPHRGGPLCDGIVSGTTVVCPLHGWKISLETGLVNKPDIPLCLQTYETRVDNGVIVVELPEQREIAA